MRVLVTGGAGFLGSHLVDRLLVEEHQVTIVDDLSTGTARHLLPGLEFIRMDVRDPLDELFAKVRPEVVVHLAAQISVPNSVHHPEYDLLVNVGGVVNVMGAAARTGVRKVINISSAAVYGVPNEVPLREGSQTVPVSPYGLSKLTGEMYTRMLGDMRGVAYTILRPANIYGPRQTTEGEGAVVPAFLSRFLGDSDPIIHGDGKQTRDFVYVGDMVTAILLSLVRADGLTLNVSSGVGTTVKSLWQELASLIAWNRSPVFGKERSADIRNSILANDAARFHLKWVPQVSLETGLAETVTATRGISSGRDGKQAAI